MVNSCKIPMSARFFRVISAVLPDLHSNLGAILLHPTVDCTEATFAHPFGPQAGHRMIFLSMKWETYDYYMTT